MFCSAVPASTSSVSREIMFEPSRAILVITCWLMSACDISTTPRVTSSSSGRQMANSTMLWPRLDARRASAP